jgi:UPF0716 protein FxsA
VTYSFTTPPRRRRWPWLVLLAFLVVPVLEIYVLIQVGQVIGAWWVVALLIAGCMAGSWLIRHEGARAFEALRVALNSGRMPARELADGALILAGGTLLIVPGFLSDIVGIFLLLPFTRPLNRRLLALVVARRIGGPRGGGRGDGGPNDDRPGAGPQGPVVRGEVVDQ